MKHWERAMRDSPSRHRDFVVPSLRASVDAFLGL